MQAPRSWHARQVPHTLSLTFSACRATRLSHACLSALLGSTASGRLAAHNAATSGTKRGMGNDTSMVKTAYKNLLKDVLKRDIREEVEKLGFDGASNRFQLVKKLEGQLNPTNEAAPSSSHRR